jgi:hypothetical protein
MAGFWQVTGTTSVGGASTPLAPPTGAGGVQVRIRAIQSSASASGALAVSDSVLGTIFTVTGSAFALTHLDIRGSVGGTLTVTQASGNGLNVQGDYVPQGWPLGLT